MPELSWWKWLLGAWCAFNIGVAKTGVPGLGIFAIPLFVFTVGDARLSAGWLLPVLISADVFAVYYYRRHPAAKRLFSLMPSVFAGLVVGAWVLRYDDRVLRPLVGAIILVMLGLYLLRQRAVNPMPTEGAFFTAFYGVFAGFATMIANAAGPVMNLYLLTKKLAREDFVATGAWFFFFVNLAKLPVYVSHEMISRTSLAFDAAMLPAVIAGALTGRQLLKRIPQKAFEFAVLGLTLLATVALFVPAR
ncbi:MAG: sulfite exporter TauE/SafE family protein [Bryobacteraceae bacterium]|nr:sulfite exporter TauE/SafE family protein [Bryobacteraceae bacterium]MDW8379118.1 sulfite exporter TauE/SafE family protein [Bryobacterales bacterium]